MNVLETNDKGKRIIVFQYISTIIVLVQISIKSNIVCLHTMSCFSSNEIKMRTLILPKYTQNNNAIINIIMYGKLKHKHVS